MLRETVMRVKCLLHVDGIHAGEIFGIDDVANFLRQAVLDFYESSAFIRGDLATMIVDSIRLVSSCNSL